MLLYVTVCYSVLQCVAVRVAVCYSYIHVGFRCLNSANMQSLDRVRERETERMSECLNFENTPFERVREDFRMSESGKYTIEERTKAFQNV